MSRRLLLAAALLAATLPGSAGADTFRKWVPHDSVRVWEVYRTAPVVEFRADVSTTVAHDRRAVVLVASREDDARGTGLGGQFHLFAERGYGGCVFVFDRYGAMDPGPCEDSRLFSAGGLPEVHDEDDSGSRTYYVATINIDRINIKLLAPGWAYREITSAGFTLRMGGDPGVQAEGVHDVSHGYERFWHAEVTTRGPSLAWAGRPGVPGNCGGTTTLTGGRFTPIRKPEMDCIFASTVATNDKPTTYRHSGDAWGSLGGWQARLAVFEFPAGQRRG